VGQKKFLAALLQPVRSVGISSERFFFILVVLFFLLVLLLLALPDTNKDCLID